MTADKLRVGVIGAGTMGNGIAQLFAASGFAVTMRDLKQQFLDRDPLVREQPVNLLDGVFRFAAPRQCEAMPNRIDGQRC